MQRQAITQFEAPFRGEPFEPADASRGDTNDEAQIITPRDTLSAVLFEQLDYLIQFADQESDRLKRVRAILMETFN